MRQRPTFSIEPRLVMNGPVLVPNCGALVPSTLNEKRMKPVKSWRGNADVLLLQEESEMKTTSLLLALLLYLVLPSMIRCEEVGRDHSNAAKIRVGGEVRVSSNHSDWNFGEAFAAADHCSLK